MMKNESIIAAKRACVIWFTGLSGSGKSTLALMLKTRLWQDHQIPSVLLDGDELRQGLCSDLGFSDEDRSENIRRVSEMGRLLVSTGMLTIVACISPFEKDRQLARKRYKDGGFVEVFVDTPLHVCEERDPKQLYARARDHKIAQFTGLDSTYQPPKNAEIWVHNGSQTIEDSIAQILSYLTSH